MIEILSNGSKWLGEEPDTIETLLEVLKTHTLEPDFENYGNFIMPYEKMTSFFGNFYDLSHVFRINTDEPDVIERLSRAIRENQNTDAYREAQETRRQQNLADLHKRRSHLALRGIEYYE